MSICWCVFVAGLYIVFFGTRGIWIPGATPKRIRMAPKTPPPLTPAELLEVMGRWRMGHEFPSHRALAMQWAAYVKRNGYHTQAVFINLILDGVPGIVVLYSTAQSTGLQRAGQDFLKSSGDILYQCNSVCNFVCSCIKSYENQTAFRIFMGMCRSGGV